MLQSHGRVKHPPQSPDLNPTQHLWDLVEQDIHIMNVKYAPNVWWCHVNMGQNLWLKAVLKVKRSPGRYQRDVPNKVANGWTLCSWVMVLNNGQESVTAEHRQWHSRAHLWHFGYKTSFFSNISRNLCHNSCINIWVLGQTVFCEVTVTSNYQISSLESKRKLAPYMIKFPPGPSRMKRSKGWDGREARMWGRMYLDLWQP